MDEQNKQKIEELDQAFEKVKEHQKQKLVIDFDEAVEEYRKDHPAIEIKFEGQVYEAPSSVPSDIMLFLIDNLEGGSMDDETAIKLLPMIFGSEISAAMKKSKAPFSLISEKILAPIMKHWGFGQAGYEEDEKNAQTPAS